MSSCLDKSSTLLLSIMLKRSVELLMNKFSSHQYFIYNEESNQASDKTSMTFSKDDTTYFMSYPSTNKKQLENNPELYDREPTRDYSNVTIPSNISQNEDLNEIYQSNEHYGYFMNTNKPNPYVVQNNVEYVENTPQFCNNGLYKGDAYCGRISSSDLRLENQCDIILPDSDDLYIPRRISVDMSHSGSYDEVVPLQIFDYFPQQTNSNKDLKNISIPYKNTSNTRQQQIKWNENIVNMNHNASICKSRRGLTPLVEEDYTDCVHNTNPQKQNDNNKPVKQCCNRNNMEIYHNCSQYANPHCNANCDTNMVHCKYEQNRCHNRLNRANTVHHYSCNSPCQFITQSNTVKSSCSPHRSDSRRKLYNPSPCQLTNDSLRHSQIRQHFERPFHTIHPS